MKGYGRGLEEAGPWLSRPMRDALGLAPPERRLGLAAHDFAQALGAREVYLTRALKVDGVPTVPSRWLQRLLALVKAAGLENKVAPVESWVSWARERDNAPPFDPVKAARAETALGSAAAQIERDPHRTMDRKSVRDLRARHLEARTAESARHRARRGLARSDHPSRLAGILARPSREVSPTISKRR